MVANKLNIQDSLDKLHKYPYGVENKISEDETYYMTTSMFYDMTREVSILQEALKNADARVEFLTETVAHLEEELKKSEKQRAEFFAIAERIGMGRVALTSLLGRAESTFAMLKQKSSEVALVAETPKETICN